MPQASMKHLEPIVLDYEAAKAVGEDRFLRHLRKQMGDAIKAQGVTGTAMKRSVYVVRLKGAFLIAYPGKPSPVIYIGRGDAPLRLASHLKRWMRHVHNFGSDTTVEIKIVLPLRQGRLDYFKYVEGTLISEHESIYGAIPLFNARRELSYGDTVSARLGRCMIFGPPAEVGARADLALSLGQVAASCADRVHEVVQGGYELVDDGLVHQGPERLGRLEFGTVGRQVHQLDAVRHGEVGAGVEAGVVEQEHDAFVGSGADCRGEGGEQAGEQRLGHAIGQVPHRFARGRAHEGSDVEPFEAVVTEGCRALPSGSPHRAQHRFQAEAVLVGAEHLDRDAGVGGRLFGDGFRQLYGWPAPPSAAADSLLLQSW